MSLNESHETKGAQGRLGSYDHLPWVQETSLVSYCILVSYFIPVSYCIPASAYGLKAISDWLEIIFHFKIKTKLFLSKLLVFKRILL